MNIRKIENVFHDIVRNGDQQTIESESKAQVAAQLLCNCSLEQLERLEQLAIKEIPNYLTL